MPSHDRQDSPAPGSSADEVIADYLGAIDRGEEPKPEDIIARHQEIAEELTAFFDDCHDFGQATAIYRNLLDQETKPSGVPVKTLNTPGSPASLNHQFGDYELLEEIDRGGMGVVYKARQISLNRIVALKMILSGRFATPEDIQRFHVEAEAAANLEHPGIVPIHQIGEHDGQHYYSMSFISGDSLKDRLRDGPMSPWQAASLMKKICEAVQYAHEHNIIHRDLKPANVLLMDNRPEAEPGAETSEADFQTDLQPMVTDFGLAKRLNSEVDLTKTGQIIGSPCYMSPEQATGATEIVGPESDVYSLGAILYQMLTGKPAVHAETPLDILAQLSDSEPMRPRLVNRQVPPELEVICLKCLEKELDRRYSSARELGDELQRFLDGDPVHATGIKIVDHLRRALRQSRHDKHFHGWGMALIVFGLVIFVCHAGIYMVAQGHWQISYYVPRSVMFIALFIIFWRYRRHSLLPTNSAERLVWVVWIGYLLALWSLNAARYALGHDHQEIYASSATLAGLGFIVMGCHVWGGGYVVGAAFLISAPFLAIFQDIAPLVFGGIWAVALGSFGFHYLNRRST